MIQMHLSSVQIRFENIDDYNPNRERKISPRKELQNIAINHSADIGYKDFMRIYRECTNEPYSFLTIDTTLKASDPLRFRENLLPTYKMTVTGQIKILDRKIMQNEAQFDLDRKRLK